MYDPILNKSFSKNEQRRFGCGVIVCLIITLVTCMNYKSQFHPLSVIGDAMNLQLSITAAQERLMVKDTINPSPVHKTSSAQERFMAIDMTITGPKSRIHAADDGPLVNVRSFSRPLGKAGDSEEGLNVKNTIIVRPIGETDAAKERLIFNDTNKIMHLEDTDAMRSLEVKNTRISLPSGEPSVVQEKNMARDTGISRLSSESDVAEERLEVKTTSISMPVGDIGDVQGNIPLAKDRRITRPSESGVKKQKLTCNIQQPVSDYCEMEGDIRIQGNSSTVYLVSPDINYTPSANTSWMIQPYPRKGIEDIKKWSIKLVGNKEDVPRCSVKYGLPAILFSLGGYSGNHFHDFADLVIPIYSTAQQFNGDVHFVATNYQRWWIGKFRAILGKLSKHEIVNIDSEKEVHCFPSMVVGLKCHKELDIDPSRFSNGLSMSHFRQFLRSTFSLKRSKAVKLKKGNGKRPRLMIISRKKTRVILNENEVVEMAKSLGFDVVVAEANLSSDLSRFAHVVNSCDVLMGVHGAGLTNMVFLPDNAVLVQVIPYGPIDGFARTDFGSPSRNMKVRYLDYKIRPEESSLIQQYPLSHAVFKNPFSFLRQGWLPMRSIYLDKQNFKIDTKRFRDTLLRARRILRY